MPDMGAWESDVVNSLEQSDKSKFPTQFMLKQNYPNPFNPNTNIEFQIPKTEFVTLKIYNLLGQEVATLVSDKLAAGKYKCTWNASGISSGVYIFQLIAGEFEKTRKLILMR
jgi:hypothetical protein